MFRVSNDGIHRIEIICMHDHISKQKVKCKSKMLSLQLQTYYTPYKSSVYQETIFVTVLGDSYRYLLV